MRGLKVAQDLLAIAEGYENSVEDMDWCAIPAKLLDISNTYRGIVLSQNRLSSS